MPRPGDWDAIGLSSDPTPGDPDTISQLTDIFQHLGGKAREIYAAIELVMNSADDSVFSGQTADALRSKVDQRLRGHVEDVAWAFESAAGALRDWHGVVVEQQSRADAALNAGRGLADDDPERQRQADIATQAGEYQAEQGRSVAGRIRSVSHIALPISACEIFWEAFKWLAIILIIPALVFGGPIALIALGVNLTLFIKTVVDFANGDASFLDLFLAGLGLIAPTTKGLPIFNIIKSVGSAVANVGKAFFQGFKQLFTREFLFTRLLPGLSHLPMLASVAIRETGLFVLTGLRNVIGFTGGIFRAGGPLSLTGITRLPGVIAALPGRAWQGTKIWWKAGAPGRQAFRESVAFHFGGTKFLRIILPVDAGEIRAFGFWKALRIGLFDRGVLGQYRFGAPLVSGIGHTISAVPINPGSALGDGLTGLSHVSAPPPVDLSALRISNDFGSVTSSGFHAAKQLDSLDGIRLTDIVNVRTGDLGISVGGTTSVTSSGLHVPSTAGTSAAGLHIPATSVLPGATHLPGTNVVGVGFNVAPGNGVTNLAAAHLPPPAAASIGDLIAPGVRNATPTVSPNLGTNIGEGTTHGLIANQLRLGLDDLVNLPPTHLQNTPVDRISAAMQLVDHKPASVTTPNVFHADDAARAGSANGAPLHTAPHQPVNIPVKPLDLPGNNLPGTAGRGPADAPNPPGRLPADRVDVPLKGLPDQPGAYIRIEEHGGGLATYQLFDGGPHGRMDVLPGGHVRFTDDATGQTFRFDDSGALMDKGVRLTKGDGVLRMDDRVVVHRPDGSFRVTTLAGDGVPEQLTVRPLEGGGVQVVAKDGVNWNYGQNGRLQGQSVGAAWDSDIAARAGVFRKPGDTDDLVATRMDDFTDVQRAQQNFDVAKTDVDLHGGRGDGTSNGPSVGDKVNLNLHGAEQDLSAAKNAFQTEHGLQVDSVQRQLDDLLATSIHDRPRDVGGAPGRSGGGSSRHNPMGSGPIRTSSVTNDVTVTAQGQSILSVDTHGVAGLTHTVDGGLLKLTKAGPDGLDVHTWTYQAMRNGSLRLDSESVRLSDGAFDGRMLEMDDVTFAGRIDDGQGGSWPVRADQDTIRVASPLGTLSYDRTTGLFRQIEPSIAGHLPPPVPPAYFGPERAARWTASVEQSRIHLGAATVDNEVWQLMDDVTNNAFTSQRGYGGFIDLNQVHNVDDLVSKAEKFVTVTDDLAMHGPNHRVTLYRGLSMDPRAASANEFLERLPSSTSNNFEFQRTWAQNGVQGNRVVFEIDVPPQHGKLAMAYPDGYVRTAGDGPPVNPTQFEVTLAPTKLTRTGPNRLDGDLTIIPVRAEQVPAGQLDDLIRERWSGLSSQEAYDEFRTAFSPDALRKFQGMADVSATTLVDDGLRNVVRVTKPGSNDVLELTVTRNAVADSIAVDARLNGERFFGGNWSGTDFADIATDLRAGVLHNSEKFAGKLQPLSWRTAPKSATESAAADVAAHLDVFRRAGDSHDAVLARMDDFKLVQRAQDDFDAAVGNQRAFGDRGAGTSGGLSQGDQVHLDLFRKQQELTMAKELFQHQHQMSADDILQQLDDLRTASINERPRVIAKGRPKTGEVPGEGLQLRVADDDLSVSGATANNFRPERISDNLFVVHRLGADGNSTAQSWYFRPFLGKLVHAGDGFPLTGGALDGQQIMLTLNRAGAHDGGHVTDAFGTKWPVRLTDDGMVIATPDGPQRFTRNGIFQGPEPTQQLPVSALPDGFTGDPARWTNAMDVSRLHLTEAADKTSGIHDLIRKVQTGRFTGKRGYGGYVKEPSGQLIQDTEHFHRATQDLLFKGPDREITLYRNVDMDRATANGTEFVERVPSSTSQDIGFQVEWTRKGLPENTYVFEIDVPAGHGKLAMSYPPGYRLLDSDPLPLNQAQSEITLAPTRLIRTGDTFDRVVDGTTLKIIPVRAEQIPAAQLKQFLNEKWPGLPIDTAYDDLVRAFDQGAITNWPGFKNAVVRSEVGADGNITTLTVSRPGSPGELTVTVTRNTDDQTVSVSFAGGDRDLTKGPWKSTDLSDIAAKMRSTILHDSDEFAPLPRPAGWPAEAIEVRMQHLSGDVVTKLDNALPATVQGLLDANPGSKLDNLANGQFRVTQDTKSFHFTAAGDLFESRFGLAGSTDRFVVRDADGLMRLEGADDFTVRALDDGGFRVFGADGHAQRYTADGVHLGDGRSLVDGNNHRGNLFVEENGTRLVDLQGQPVPGRTIDDLGNHRYFVSSDDGDIRWYAADGSVEGTGIRVADPAHPGTNVYLFRADGAAPALVDQAAARLPGTVEMLPGNGFRVTETNGVARSFDQAGLYVDRRVPLPDPAGGQQRLLVHDSNNVLTVLDRNGANLNHTAQRLADDGYRVTDGNTYHVYDSVGTHQARGHAANLPGGDNGFLELGANGWQRLDPQYAPMPGRAVTPTAAGDLTVARVGGHDVFNTNGQLLHEVTDIRPNALDSAATRVTRDADGSVHWTAADGTPMATPHTVTMSPAGVTRLEINLPNGLRHGEYHDFSRAGQVVEQGFPVVRNGRSTGFSYVVDHVAGTWRRVGDDTTGAFLTGKIDVAGAANGRIKLLSSSGKPVEVFERRWLADGTILDSFRRTDTLGFGRFDRSATWVSYGQDGTTSGWGLRRFDTTGSGWQDLDGFTTIREFRDGLQKYGTSNGHVLAARNGDNWHWYKYDGQGGLVADGVRVRERLGDGWTDTVTRTVDNAPVTEVAQQKWGAWHGTATAGQYREFTLIRGADGVVDRPGTWDQLARQGRDTGSATTVPGGMLEVVRRGEQRPPVWVRERPLFGDKPPTGIVSHLGDDNRFQIFDWRQTGNNPGQGTRYVGADASLVDVDRNGAFVRSTGKLPDGTTLKVGDHAARPGLAHPQGGIPWEAGGQRGWRVTNGNSWQDFTDLNGQWTLVRESHPGGMVRDFPDPQNRNIWVQRDAHGNLSGTSSRALGDGPERYVVANGATDSSNWRWFEVDGTGTRIADSGGKRQFFRGSADESLSWDDSFRDFDAANGLVRDRRMLDGGRYVESWQTGGQWRSVELDKFGRQIPGTELTRLWSTGGEWQTVWTRGADYFADAHPPGADGVRQVVRETPLHIQNSPHRVREYHQNAGQSDYAQWKEFDHGAVVRDRKLSGTNYLETDSWRNQWKLYDQNGTVIGERGHDGLVFELRDGRLRLTGSEYDFRGSLTEMRGWGRRLREAQRMPWLHDGDWTLGSTTIVPRGNPALREAAYAPYLKSVLQKAMIEFGQDFLLEFTANLIVNAIIADVQGRSFTGKDALRALMNAGVSSTIKTGLGVAMNDVTSPLRTFRQGLVNTDAGKHWSRRPLNHDRLWTNEWTGNESATRWRGGTYDYGLNFVPSMLGGFVNGTMNAAIFGVSNADGTTVKLTGLDAVHDGAVNMAATLTTGAATALVKTVATGFGGGRFFHRQGFADFWLQIPFRMFEKTIQGLFLTSNYRASINPDYYRSTEPIGGSSLLVLPPGVEIPPPVPHASGLVLPAGTGGTA